MKITIYLSFNLNIIDFIIQCYALMIKNNIIILSHNINNQDRIELFIILRFIKKAFQHLYQCVIFILIFDFKKRELLNLSKNTFIMF